MPANHSSSLRSSLPRIGQSGLGQSLCAMRLGNVGATAVTIALPAVLVVTIALANDTHVRAIQVSQR